MAEFTYYAVAFVDDLAPGERVFVEIGDLAIVVFNVGGQFYSIGDVCTHDGGPLGEGEMDNHEVICPRHGARFDIRDGRAVKLPAAAPTKSYPIRVNNNNIEVGIPIEG